MTQAEFTDVPFVVEPGYDGWRLDHYLVAKLKTLSRARVQRLIERALVAEGALRASSRVHAGQRFAIRQERRAEPATP